MQGGATVAGSLTEQVLAFREGRASLEESVNAVWIAVWKGVARLDEDDRSEFILFFHRRIPGMLRRYDPSRGAFEAYLATSIKYQLKSFAVTRIRERQRRSVPEDPTFWRNSGEEITGVSEAEEMTEAEETPVIVLKEAAAAYRAHNRRFHRGAFKRRLLYVTLKCSLYASEENLRQMAGFLEIDQPQLLDLAAELSRSLKPRIERRRRLQERQNEVTYQIHTLRKELESTPEEPRKKYLYHALRSQEERSRALTEEIDHVPDYVNNREIAKLLKVPKGSVDSGIFYVRSVLKRSRSRSEVAERCQSLEREERLP
jgi:hypothetical protein